MISSFGFSGDQISKDSSRHKATCVWHLFCSYLHKCFFLQLIVNVTEVFLCSLLPTNSYISCNPESLVANAIELCTPTADEPEKAKGNRGWRKMSSAGLARHRTKSMPKSEPFRPVRVMAVDMFPHTPHCETVMLLER